MRNFEAERRRMVCVENPSVGFLPAEKRHALFKYALAEHLWFVRDRIRLVQEPDRYPVYQEGHLIRLGGEKWDEWDDWKVILRVWNTTSKEVVYILARSVGGSWQTCALHEEFVVEHDVFHGETSREFYQQMSSEKSCG